MNDNDGLMLAEEPAKGSERLKRQPWRVLVVDDEEEVHAVSKLALEDFEFNGRGLEMIHAYSGQEAKEIMAKEAEIALILLDVVMETDHAGLEVVQYIREQLGNRFVRIILRTGQPGQAPEYKVITEYDINDYKSKTELTRQKLFTAVYTSLSSYRDLMAIECNRKGLEKVIEASTRIFELHSLEPFAEGVLEQLTALLYLEQDAMVLKSSALAAEKQNGAFEVIAAIGRFAHTNEPDWESHLDPQVRQRIEETLRSQSELRGEDFYACYYCTDGGGEHALYVATDYPIRETERHLLQLFVRNVAIAHNNIQRISG